MGDLEISACINIYNDVILVFELNDNNELTILDKYGDQISEDKILLTLFYIDEKNYSRKRL